MNKNCDIAFLILNFNSNDELKKCIKSIKQYAVDYNYKIVVVDNGSSRENVEELKKLSRNNIEFTLIINGENLGFARGNNVGFRFIREHIPCKYIAMINSDVQLIEEGLLDKLEDAYSGYNFAVLGPDILYRHNNPMENKLNTKGKVLLEIRKMRFERAIIKLPLINLCYLAYKRIGYKMTESRKTVNQVKENCLLHGSFLVFSEKYNMEGLCPDTFLYGEEAVLAKECADNGFKMLYYPHIKILHNESGATKRAVPQRIKRKIYYYDNYIDSLNVLVKKFQ